MLRSHSSKGVQTMHWAGAVPVHWQKGRGAVDNPQGRFELQRREREPQLDQLAATAPLQTQVQIEIAKSIITRNQSPDIFFDQSINPYRGCEHGCIYCYARPNHSLIGLSPGQDFESKLFAKTNAAALLRSELAAPNYQCSPINIGSVTDAYQPIEREFAITRQLLEVLESCQHPVSLITKSSLIERDIDLLSAMARRKLVSVYISVTTLDAALAAHWEPRAAAPWRRIEAIRRLSEAGIPVGVMVAPIVPFINDPDIENVLQQARAAGARSAHYTVLRLPYELKEVFVAWLQHHYPLRAKRVLARIADLRGGDRLNSSEFFTRMKGEGAWAALIKMRFEMATHKLGLTRDRLPLTTSLFQANRARDQLPLF